MAQDPERFSWAEVIARTEFQDFARHLTRGERGEAVEALLGAVVGAATTSPTAAVVVAEASRALRQLATGATDRLIAEYQRSELERRAQLEEAAFLGRLEQQLQPWFLSTVRLLAELRQELGGARSEQTSQRRAWLPWLSPAGASGFVEPGSSAVSATSEGYLERRLGIDQADAAGNRATHLPTVLAYEQWAEANYQHTGTFIDFRERDVLRSITAAAVQESKLWLIQGAPGSGKTRLVEHWLSFAVERLPNEPRHGLVLPVWVRFRDLPQLPAGNDLDLEEFFWRHAALAELAARRSKLYAFERAARYVPLWFLDGWDEGREEYRTGAFATRLNLLRGAKVITCRSAVLAEMRRHWRAPLQLATPAPYTLRDLSNEEQTELLAMQLSDPGRAIELQARLRKDTPLRFIASSPLLLSFIAGLEARGALSLASSRSEFYRAAVEHQWAVKFSERSPSIEVLADRALQRLALRLGVERLHATQTELVQAVEERAHLDVDRVCGAIVRAGILQRTMATSGSARYEFVHLTFQEYYLARAWLAEPGALGEGASPFGRALARHFADPRYDEALALALAERVREGGTEEAHSAVLSLCEHGRRLYETDRAQLFRLGRSPLSAALTLIHRAGIADEPWVRPLGRRFVVDGARCELRPLAVASNQAAPATVLDGLAGHEVDRVRAAVAQNPSAPARALERLANDGSLAVRAALASNANAPAWILAQLALETEPSVRVALAKNPSTPSAALDALAGDTERDVRWPVSRHPNTPPSAVERLLHDEDRLNIVVAAASHRNLPRAAMQALVQSRDTDRRSLAAHQTRNVADLEPLSGDPEASVRCGVAWNARATAAIRERLARDADADVRWAVARNDDTPASVLDHLAGDNELHVRIMCARKQATPEPARQRLARDASIGVRGALAENRSNSASLFQILAGDAEAAVRYGVAWNDSTPAATLELLGHDPDAQVRYGVSYNRSSPASILEWLARDPDDEVRFGVASNPRTPETALHTLAKDPMEKVRQTVANNTSTSPLDLERLAADPSHSVRSEAASNSGTPADTSISLAGATDESIRLAVSRNGNAAALEWLANDPSLEVRQMVARRIDASASVLDQLAVDADADVRAAVARNDNTFLESL